MDNFLKDFSAIFSESFGKSKTKIAHVNTPTISQRFFNDKPVS